jgi:hypothetical protein
MIIETICERGVVRLPAELKFQHDTFKVKVEVPDREVSPGSLAENEQSDQADLCPGVASGLRARIDAILGPYKNILVKGEPYTSQDYKDMRHQHLEEKYLGRRKTSDS